MSRETKKEVAKCIDNKKMCFIVVLPLKLLVRNFWHM